MHKYAIYTSIIRLKYAIYRGYKIHRKKVSLYRPLFNSGVCSYPPPNWGVLPVF